MKVYVTGVAGFLGSHLAEKLVLLGHEVRGNDSFIGGYRDNIPNNMVFDEVDCCDYDKMVRCLKGFDVLYHCAATAHEGLSVFSPNFITKNIYQASVSVISAAISSGVRRIVFCSSMARYGDQDGPFIETMQPRPVDPYGIAKVAVENTLINLASVHDIEYNIAVPHNIIGPKQIYDDPYRNVLSIMINRNLQGKPPIIYGDGEQTRCFSYIDDVVYCLERLAFDESVVSETINVGPDEDEISINELSKLVQSLSESKLSPIYVPERPQEVRRAVCSSDKARLILGYRTSTSIHDGIRKTYDYIKNRGVRPFNYNIPIEIESEKTPSTWTKRII